MEWGLVAVGAAGRRMWEEVLCLREGCGDLEDE